MRADGLAQWQLQNGNGETMTLTLPPRLAAHHFTVLRDAALSYLGSTYLPETYCRDDRERDPQAKNLKSGMR